MKNSINIAIPDFITRAFPVLKEATYVREFASFITLYPDATYYLFQTTSNQSLILVAIDYPDPIDESLQVKRLSGGFEFEFIHLIKPYANDQHIEIRPNDDMDEMFSVPDPNGRCHYYLAAVKQRMDW
ncbi:hypothetical protein QQ965_03565 [Candidatus Saccharibacteria bacterium oral taxon 955]